MDISKPLKALMIYHNVQAKSLAEALGVTENTISRWRQNSTGISGENFDAILKYFKVKSALEFYKWGVSPNENTGS